MKAGIGGIAYYLPEKELDNASLAAENPEWTMEKIQEKTGIRCRRIAGAEECASDLGVAACQKLFEQGACKPEEIDFLLCRPRPV